MSDVKIPDFLKSKGAIRAGDSSVGKLKVLIYGDPGTGKTHAGATLPQPSLHLLSEGHGDLTVKRVSPEAHIIKIKNHNHLLDILDGLTYEEHPYVSVCMDSITDMQELVRKNMKGDKVGEKMSLPDWGKLLDMTEDLIKRFRDLDMHVVVIALSAESQDDGNRFMFSPSLTGRKLPKKVPAFFNIVGYQTKRKVDGSNRPMHITILDGDDRYVTKTHPALNPIEIPNISTWVDKINASGEGVIPTEVMRQERIMTEGEQDLLDAENLISDPDIAALFDELGTTRGARLAAARKYKTAESLSEAIAKKAGKK